MFNFVFLILQDDNETVVLNTFTNCILRHKVVTPTLASVLVAFLVHHVDQLFTVPQEIKEKVNDRLLELKSDQVVPVRGMCHELATYTSAWNRASPIQGW